MKTLIFFITVFLLGSITFGQTNFSGIWVLNDKEHIVGPQYANALPTRLTIQQQADSLIIESVNTGVEGKETTSRHAIPMNGQPSTITSLTSKRKYVRSLNWAEDKKVLTITVIFYLPDKPDMVDLTRVETWNLLPDGAHLSIGKKSIEKHSETWEVKGMYNRR
ncbi:MAG: hypothetical protein J7497_01320 [Chitinophagaceae bacterium]|nr:hypothetical protein [Chitinophagaceae bacterium]